MGRRRQQFILGLALSVAGLVAVFLAIEPDAVWAGLIRTRPLPLAASGVFILAYMGLRAVRWRFLLDDEPTLARVFHIQNVGYMLTQLLPFRAGDVARAVLIGRTPPVTIARGFSTMIVERVLDMLLIIILLPPAAANVTTLPDWMRDGARLSTVAAVGATAALVAAANFRRPAVGLLTRLRLPARLVDAADHLLAGLSTLTHWRSGLMLAFWSVVTWIPIGIAYHFALIATNNRPTPTMTIVVLCAAALSIAAPASPSSAGVFHAAVTFVLTSVFAADAGAASSFAFVYHAFNFAIIVLLGAIGLRPAGVSWRSVVRLGQSETAPGRDTDS